MAELVAVIASTHRPLYHKASTATGVTRALLNKFLFTVDRDPELVERYRDDPQGTVTWWAVEHANRLLNGIADERSTWLAFDDVERAALGAHPFLTLTLLIAMSERDHAEPLGFQLEYARRLAHFSLPYPDIAT